MAITSDVTAEIGVVRGAYTRITSFSGDKGRVSVSAETYLDQTAREAGAASILTTSISFDYPEAGPLLVAAYGALKETVFVGAQDV